MDPLASWGPEDRGSKQIQAALPELVTGETSVECVDQVKSHFAASDDASFKIPYIKYVLSKPLES